MQSLVRRGVVSDLVADYGHVVVDECHHLSAVGFEAIARAAKARYVLGLSATVTRKDGHHPIIFMQCGPVRHRVDARKQAATRPFDHKVIFRRTEFRLPRRRPDEKPAIQELYAKLAQDPARNDLIFDDILSALEDGRSPVVITERKDHLDILAEPPIEVRQERSRSPWWHGRAPFAGGKRGLGDNLGQRGTGACRYGPLPRRGLR